MLGIKRKVTNQKGHQFEVSSVLSLLPNIEYNKRTK